MPFRTSTWLKDFSTALAVLAVYVLVLLAPLHQAAGLQKDLAQLGYDSLTNWSICSAALPDQGTGKSAADIKCPAAGIGKYELAASEPVAIDVPFERFSENVAYAEAPAVLSLGLSRHIAEARAPPATV